MSTVGRVNGLHDDTTGEINVVDLALSGTPDEAPLATRRQSVAPNRWLPRLVRLPRAEHAETRDPWGDGELHTAIENRRAHITPAGQRTTAALGATTQRETPKPDIPQTQADTVPSVAEVSSGQNNTGPHSILAPGYGVETRGVRLHYGDRLAALRMVPRWLARKVVGSCVEFGSFDGLPTDAARRAAIEDARLAVETETDARWHTRTTKGDKRQAGQQWQEEGTVMGGPARAARDRAVSARTTYAAAQQQLAEAGDTPSQDVLDYAAKTAAMAEQANATSQQQRRRVASKLAASWATRESRNRQTARPASAPASRQHAHPIRLY